MELAYKHLCGRRFEFGSNDCYGLVRSFYKDNFDIELTDYARPDGFWEAGIDLYRMYFEDEGFHLVDIQDFGKLRPADVLLVCIGHEIPTHCGVYVGNGQVLHHYRHRFSELHPLRGIFRHNVVAVLRHKDVPDLTPKPQPVDVLDLLPAFKRRELNG